MRTVALCSIGIIAMLMVSAIPIVLSQDSTITENQTISTPSTSALHVGMQTTKPISDLDRYGNRPMATLDNYAQSLVFNQSKTSNTEPWVSIPSYAKVIPQYPPGMFLTSSSTPSVPTLVQPMLVGAQSNSAIGQPVQVGSNTTSAIGQPVQLGSNPTSAIGQNEKIGGILSSSQPATQVYNLENYSLVKVPSSIA